MKVEINQLDKEGFFLSLTKNRFNLIKDKFLDTFLEVDGKNIFFKDFKIKTLTNSVKITGDVIDALSEKILALDAKIINLTTELYLKKLGEIEEKFDFLEEFATEIAKIDVAISSAKVAKERNYHRPKISSKKAEFKNLDIL